VVVVMASFADAPAGDVAAGEKIFKTVSAVHAFGLRAAVGSLRSHVLPLSVLAEMRTVPHC
jgi:hypothetical protein